MIIDKKRDRINKTPILMLLIIFCMLITGEIVSASLGGYDPNECVDIRTNLNTTDVTIGRLDFPNSTKALGITNMDKDGLTFNYTFCSTETLGIYIYNYNDSEGNTYVNDFVIGKVQSVSQGIGSMVFLALMIILMVLFGFIGYKLSKSDYWWVLGIFFMFLAILLLVYNTWLGYEYHRNLTGLGDSAIPEIIFYIFLFVLVLGLLTSIVLLALHWKKVFKYVKKEIRSNKKEDASVEDWDFDEWGGHGPYGS